MGQVARNTESKTYHAVKICGLARVEDAIYASYRGADLLGIVMHPPSPRCCKIEVAREIGKILFFKPRTLVFGKDEAGYIFEIADQLYDSLTYIQLPVSSPAFAPVVEKFGPGRVFPVISVSDNIDPGSIASFSEHPWVVLDTGGIKDKSGQELDGGTGQTFDWELVRGKINRPWLAAGGLKPGNIQEARDVLQAPGYDLSSGVESSPGVKDHAMIDELMQNLRFT